MLLTRFSRKWPQYLRNCFRRKLLLIILREDIRQIPSRECSSSMPAKHEWFGSIYASHFSMTGKSLVHFDLLEQTIHISGEISERQIAMFGPPRIQFSEIVCNWNKRSLTRDWQNLETPAYPQSGLPKEDQTRTDTKTFLICPRGNEEATRNATGNF